jgi:phosphoribosylglycinamide formyltransferase-1
MRRLAVLASGNGTNLQAVIDATLSGRLADAAVVVVAANHREAYALERARRHGIPAVYHPLRPYLQDSRGRAAYDADLAALLAPHAPDLVVLAGWMHILSMAFLRQYPRRVLNIHPALPGAFGGVGAIDRAYEAFLRGEIDHTGVMVHYVPDEGVDDGPVILQREVPMLPGDTLADLEARIHAVEHEIYVAAIAQALDALPA